MVLLKYIKELLHANDARPYLELFLPEKNVLGITSVLLKVKEHNTQQYHNHKILLQ